MKNILIVGLLALLVTGCVTLPENTNNGMGRIIVFSDTDNAGAGPFFDYELKVRHKQTKKVKRIYIKATKVSSYMLSDELEPGTYLIEEFSFNYRDPDKTPSRRSVSGQFNIEPNSVTLFDFEIKTVLKGYTQYIRFNKKSKQYIEEKYDELSLKRPALQTWATYWEHTNGVNFKK